MTDPLTAIESTAISDQVTAHWRDVSTATARHYTTLIETGMDPKHAVKLARDFQADLLTVNADAELVIHVEGD